MRLTFETNQFKLIGKSEEILQLLKNEKPEIYQCNTQQTECIVKIKAVAKFRHLADEKAERIINRAFVKQYSAPLAPLPPFLDAHQVEGVKWILTRSRSYLAHAPGAGKTCQAITASLASSAKGQVIFIVPPSLTVNWEREIMKFTGPHSWPKISIIPETARQQYAGWKAEFIIVPDSMLTKAWVLEHLTKIKKKLIAVDEASRFKEPTSQRTIALFGGTLKDGTTSPGLIHDAHHAVLLDGSPLLNRPMELWAPTYAMAPETIDFMSMEEFGFRYCGATINDFGKWEFKHSSNEAELSIRLQKSFMHVVSEESLGHPERKRSILYMTEDARSPVHKSWERRHLHLLKLGDTIGDTIGEEISRGELATFRRLLGLRKVEWVAKYIASRLEEKSESILLFAWHRDVCFELEKALIRFKPALVMGKTDEKAREKYFSEFMSGKRKLIIGNIASVGRGHNLQRADRVVFAEYSWTDELNKQCEKRASRKGRSQDLPVRCEYIVSPDSMDEVILQAVFKKAERVKRIIG